MATQKSTEVPVVHKGDSIIKTFDRIQDMIRERADKIFHSRGTDDGDAISDWLKAESEVLTEVDLSLKDDDNQFIVEGTIKGFSPAEVEIKAENGMLTIGGIHSEESSDEKKGVTTKSSKKMGFCRTFSLSDSVDTDKIDAELKKDRFTAKIPKVTH